MVEKSRNCRTAQDSPKVRAVNVRESVYNAITEEAKRLNISRSMLVRLAVESYLARNAAPQKETR